eukprot:TRINITY_DN4441_c0_g3_i1.p1 TRINITY_DN4441_c0_g3~~TRINITY_DN4441_c0_g3_i1.p1  ORF type:complete len:160 (-),score=12.35 TRINITY_DN4441_c0_g3_i1:31-510(-)
MQRLLKMVVRVIVWGLLFASVAVCEGISIYLYFMHDDLNFGYIGTVDATNSITKYIPIEIFLQLALMPFLLLQGSYLLFAFFLPLSIYNLTVLVKKKYKIHALFRKDYKQFSHVVKSLTFKSTFYGVAMILFFMRLILCLISYSASESFDLGSYLYWVI